jgi:MoxR-like ATPase
LPEAQLDRFLLKTLVDYPNQSEELEIMKKYCFTSNEKIKKILNKSDLSKLQKEVQDIHVDENIYEYIKDLVFFSRENKEIKKYLFL